MPTWPPVDYDGPWDLRGQNKRALCGVDGSCPRPRPKACCRGWTPRMFICTSKSSLQFLVKIVADEFPFPLSSTAFIVEPGRLSTCTSYNKGSPIS